MFNFEPDKFKELYPQFIEINNQALVMTFNHEAIILGEKVIACVDGEDDKLYWAQVVLAHILTLEVNQQTGRVSQASEGDVSGSFDYLSTTDDKWWAETTYGQKCFKLIQMCGGFIYFPPDDNNFWI